MDRRQFISFGLGGAAAALTLRLVSFIICLLSLFEACMHTSPA